MSKYLCVGIAKEVIAKVKGEKEAKEVEKDFFNTMERELYNVEYAKEDSNEIKYVIFRLKDEILVDNGIDLIIEQYEKYIKVERPEKAIEYFKKMKNKSKQEILDMINTENNEYMYNFKLGWYGFDASILFDRNISAYITEFLVYHCSEKTFMEQYYEFFIYMRNLLINSTDNPLRTALVVSL